MVFSLYIIWSNLKSFNDVSLWWFITCASLRTTSIVDTLEFLADYTIKHFSDEQELQQKYEYPHYETHKGLHDDFVQEIKDFKADFEAGNINTARMMKFNKRITQWLVDHVKGIDQKLGEHINQMK